MKGKNIQKTGTTIYTELSTAVGGLQPNEGEDKTTFLARLTEAISGLGDAEYDMLSEAARKWFNTSGEAINANTPENIPTLSGMPAIEAAPEPDPENSEEAPAAEAKPSTKKEKVMAAKAKPTVAKKVAGKKTTLVASAKKTNGKKASSDTKYVVKIPDAAKRGFLKEYIEQAVALKKFTRDEIISKIKSKKISEKRAMHYFYWCTGHNIFTQA